MMALQIVSYDEDGSIKVSDVNLKKCLESSLQKPISVVSLTGAFRKGKSTLLSLWSKEDNAFTVGHTVRAQTCGIWMKVVEENDHAIVLLDTEGWNNPQIDRLDVWLPLIAILASSEFIINVMGDADGILVTQLFSLLTACFYDARDIRSSPWDVPPIRVIIRDFDKDLDGLTEDEYLDSVLFHHGEEQRVLREHIKERTCNTLPIPSCRKNVRADDKFYQKALQIWHDIIRRATSYSSISFTGSDWLQTFISVADKVEELRRGDPKGHKIRLNMPGFKMMEKAKTIFAESLNEWDIMDETKLQKWHTMPLQELRNKDIEELQRLVIVTPVYLKLVTAECVRNEGNLTDIVQVLKRNDIPCAMNKIDECSASQCRKAKAILVETLGTLEEQDEVDLLQFTNNLHKVVSEKITKLIGKNYEEMYGSNINLQTFQNILKTSSKEIDAYKESENIMKLYLNHQLAIQQNIVAKWRQDYVEFEVVEFVKRYDSRTMSNADEKVRMFLTNYEECGLPNTKQFYLQRVDSPELAVAGIWMELISPDLDDSVKKEYTDLIKDFLRGQVSYMSKIRMFIETFCFPFLELQSEMLLLDVDYESVFGNIIEVYNCEVHVWNTYIKPLCMERSLETLVVKLKEIFMVRVDDTFSPYIQFKADFSDILTYIQGKEIMEKQKNQEFGLAYYFKWAKGLTGFDITTVLTEVADHLGEFTTSAKDALHTLDLCEEEKDITNRMVEMLRSFNRRLDMHKEEDILGYELELISGTVIPANTKLAIKDAVEIANYLRSNYDIGSYETVEITAQMVTADFAKSELNYLRQIGKLVKLNNFIEYLQAKGLLSDVQISSVFRNIQEIYDCHNKFWTSMVPIFNEALEGQKPVDVLQVGMQFIQLKQDLASYVTFLSEEKSCLKYSSKQLKEKKSSFSQLMTWVSKEIWWEGDAQQLLSLLSLPGQQLNTYTSSLEMISSCATSTAVSGCFREGVQVVNGLLLEIKKEKKNTEALMMKLERFAENKPSLSEIPLEESWITFVFPGKTKEEVLETLDRKTLKHQEAIWEVVTTERTYIKRLAFLNFAYERFAALQKENFFKNKDIASVFSNVAAVYQSHKLFFMTKILPMVEKSRQQSTVEEPTFLQQDLLLEAFEQLESILLPLIEYCLNYATSDTYIRRLKDRKMEHFLEWVQDTSGEHHKLVDLLFAPVRRLTQYGLLLEAVRSNSTEDSEHIVTVIEHVKHFTKLADKDINSEFEKKKHLLQTVWNYRIDELTKNMHELVETNPELCETMVCYHREWWVKRLEAIKLFMRLVADLNNIKLGSNIGKTASGVIGITAGGFAIASVLLPFLSPVAITLGIIVAVSSLSIYGTQHVMSRLKKDQLLGKLVADSNISSKFRTSFQEIVKLNEHMVHHNYIFEESEGWGDIADHTLTGVGAVASFGRVAFNIADVVTDPLVAAGRVAGAAVGGVGIVFDVLSMGFAIYDIAQNGSKHDLSEYVTQCIELMELEMLYYAKVAIPMKYHLYERYIKDAADAAR